MKHYLWLFIASILLLNSNKSFAECHLNPNAKPISLYFNLKESEQDINKANNKDINVKTFSAEQIASEMGIDVNAPIFLCDEENISLMFGDSVLTGKSANTEHGTGGLKIIEDKLYLYFVISGGNIGKIGYPKADGTNYSYNLGTRKKITWKDIGNVSIYLHKKGAINSGKSLSSGVIFKLEALGSPKLNLISVRHSSTYRFRTMGCMTTTPSPKVNFGNVQGSLFKGKGTTAGHANFDIIINCVENVKPKITFLGQKIKNPSDTPDSVIRLDNSNHVNTAKGVGVQILYYGTPISLGEPLVFGRTPADSSYTAHFTARYYQTRDKITGGTANATARFTIQYE
ncbi:MULTISPECIES: fimbrial protein [Photorhabdus]|uniref:Major fimbrial subunit n=2 Tax=Photorhabdus asymbiotica TaxID=291112 RepID=C7BNQ1_PHOAA|nr:fimbrial protein [Photorhabdus asymbiotica]RKS66966.1 type 1 fimbria pilin [Photorhabdus asymbiotica]CAQ83063.1 putative major fimbrial subunit [Photorhabdus asymbiotica]